MKRGNMIKSSAVSAVLALILFFFSTVGVMAQGSIRVLAVDDGFSIPASHNGKNGFRLYVRFTPPPLPSTVSEANFTATPVNIDGDNDDLNFTPEIVNLRPEPTRGIGIWSFSLRPNGRRATIGRATIELDARVEGITDEDGNGYRYVPLGVFIRYEPPFPPLRAEAGPDQDNVASGAPVTLNGTGSTVSAGVRTVEYAWARTGGTTGGTVTLTGADTLAPSFTAETLNPGDADVEHIITLTVTDNQGSDAATDTVKITVKAPQFAALVAEAGTGGSVDHEAVVPLDGTGSTVSDSNRTVTYLWTRTGGTGDNSVVPRNPALLQTSFTAETLNPGDTSVTYIFTLRVTDNQGSTAATDTVTFTVTAPEFDDLVAEAGTGGSVDSAAAVPLDGTGSTVSDSNRTVTYLWTRTGGTGDNSVVPRNPALLQTSFTAETLNPGDTSVTYIFTLRVTDNQGSTAATDTVTFTVTAPEFDDLVAEAGTGGSVDSAAAVPLDGTGSTVSDSNRTVTYLWTRTGGTGDNSVVPRNPALLQTSFTAETLNPGDTSVTYIFTLRVTDNQGSTAATDTVTFTVTAPEFDDLVAEAGTGGSVDSAAAVPLDGTGSTVSDSNRTVTYLWTRTGGTGDNSVVPRNPALLQTSFTAETLNPGDTSVTYIFTLRVTDNQGSTAATDTVTFTVTAPEFDDLVAEAGTGGSVDSAAAVPLDGTGSTVSDSNRTVTYLWTRTGGTGDNSVVPRNPALLQTSFTAETLNPGDTSVTYIFTLRVTDNQGSTAATDTVTFTVTAPEFDGLVAEAGTGGSVDSAAAVPLDGTGSTVSDSNRTVTYLWTRTGGTGDNSVVPRNPALLQTSFTAETLNPGDTSVTYIFTLRVTDNQGSTAATDTVTFTVTAPEFDDLVAEAGTGGSVDSAAAVPLDGTGSTVSDSNRTVTYLWTRTGGTGDNSVVPRNPALLQTSFTAETLNPGDTSVTYIFTLRVTDNQGSTAATDTVTFTVTAPEFDDLVAEAGTGGSVDSAAAVPLDGTGSTVSDSNRTVTYLWTRTGGTGDNSVVPRNPALLQTSFTAETLNPGDTSVTYIFTLRVTDNQGSTAATDTVTFTVTAPEFDDLVAEAGTGGSVDSAAAVPLDGTGSTVSDSNRTVTYLWTRTGGTGDNSVVPRNPALLQTSFTAETLNPGDTSVTYIFTLRVTDNQGSTAATDTVTFTVTAPEFDDLVAEAGTGGSVDSAAAVPLDGTGSTVSDSNRTVTYLWTRTGGTGDNSVVPRNPALLQTSFTAETLNPGDTSVTYIFTLRVTDNQGSTAATDTVTFTVTAPEFDDLVAEAGTGGSVDHEAAVPLDGTGSTVSDSNRTVTYLWTRTGGTGDNSVVPRNPALLQTSFTAETLNPGDTSVTYIFTLRVTDNQGSTAATDTVTFTVTAPEFDDLVAEAGTGGSVDHEAAVPLDGTGSTVSDSNRTVTYLWTRTGGTGDNSVVPRNPALLQTSFTAETLNPGDTSVTYIFTLRVTDNQGSTAATDTVTFTVTAPEFDDLVAEAGTGGSVDSAAAVPLDGTGSTVSDSNRTVTYLWTRTGGTGDNSVVPRNPALLQTSFTAETLNPGDTSVTYIFTLRVTDNQGSTAATDTVTFTVTAPEFDDLVAEAGTGGSVDHEAAVPLDGTGSTVSDSNRTVTYLWTRTGGTGDNSVVPRNPALLQTSFTAETLNPGDTSVTYIFTLRVTDNQGSDAATDTVTYTVTAPPFDALVAEAGPPKSVVSGRTVQLDGSGSQTDSTRTVTYLWTQTGGTGGTLADANTLTPSFTAPALNPGDADVIHEFTLTVSDNQNTPEATDTVEVTVTSRFADPVANAGPDQTVASGATVDLDGSGSTADRRRTLLSYSWTRTSGTGGSLIGANTATPTFTANILEDGDPDVIHEFTLTVTDSAGVESRPDTVEITVTAVLVDILVDPSNLTVQEGGSGIYRVKLSESPGRAVIVKATSGDEELVQLKNAQLLFNAGNWNEWQDVRINTLADSDTADDTVEIRHEFVTTGVALGRSGVVTVTIREVDAILRPIGNYLTARATALLGQQPGLIRFLKPDEITSGGGNFTFQATGGRLALDGKFIHDGAWGEVTGAYGNSDSGDTRSVLWSFGIHRKYFDNLLLGAMLQFDLSDHDLAGNTGRIDGTGWLVGPYFAARHAARPLYFEGRLLYGQSDNDIRFIDPHLGVRTGYFDTRRVLAQIRMEGEIAMSDGDEGPRLIPYADVRWTQDRAEAFTDKIGNRFVNRVPGQKVRTGQLELGSNVEIPIEVRTGEMTLIGGLGLVYANTEGDYIPSESRGRGRGEIGFSYDLDDNVRIDFESFYDGIGTTRHEGYGLSLSAEMKF